MLLNQQDQHASNTHFLLNPIPFTSKKAPFKWGVIENFFENYAQTVDSALTEVSLM
tara:strand:- start:467 stop:634 length:168 start_codon:yes stop_codon:yes gene_type:complete